MAKVQASTFPLVLTVPDPITGVDLKVTRDDLYAALRVGDTRGDAQIVAAQFVEMGRLQRACERAADRAESAFAQWKAKTASDYRKKAEGNGKKATDKETEQAYRTHKDYDAMANQASHYRLLGELLSDVKEGFAIKSRMLSRLIDGVSNGERVQAPGARGSASTLVTSGDDDETVPLEDLEEMVAKDIEKSRKEQKKKKGAPLAVVPPPPDDEDEEEEEEEEDEEDEEEEVKPRGRGRAPKKVTVEEEEEDEEEEEEEEDEEEEEEDEEEEEVKPRRGVRGRAAAKEEEEEEDEEEEDDEPPPPKRSPRKAPAKGKKGKK